jgi:hypothetical protein
MYIHQNAWQNHNIAFEIMEKFKYLEITIKDKNYIHKQLVSRSDLRNLRNAC